MVAEESLGANVSVQPPAGDDAIGGDTSLEGVGGTGAS